MLHVPISYRHWLAPRATQPAILEGRCLFHDGVKVVLCLMHEEQVLYEGHFLTDTYSLAGDQVPFHRNENLHLHSFQQLISGYFGVCPFQVAHYVPPHSFFAPCKCRHFASGHIYQSCKIVNISINQAVINTVRKSSGFLPVLVPLLHSRSEICVCLPLYLADFQVRLHLLLLHFSS